MTKMCSPLVIMSAGEKGEEEGRGEGQSGRRAGEEEMHFKQRHQGGPL